LRSKRLQRTWREVGEWRWSVAWTREADGKGKLAHAGRVWGKRPRNGRRRSRSTVWQEALHGRSHEGLRVSAGQEQASPCGPAGKTTLPHPPTSRALVVTNHRAREYDEVGTSARARRPHPVAMHASHESSTQVTARTVPVPT
jgi:hypothetical protein